MFTLPKSKGSNASLVSSNRTNLHRERRNRVTTRFKAHISPHDAACRCRERTVRHEPQEQQQRPSSRGRRAEQQQQPTPTTREQADTAVALKVLFAHGVIHPRPLPQRRTLVASSPLPTPRDNSLALKVYAMVGYEASWRLFWRWWKLEVVSAPLPVA